MSKFHRHSNNLSSSAESQSAADANPFRRRIRPWVVVVLLFPFVGVALVAGLYLSKPKPDKANETFALVLDTYSAPLLEPDAKEQLVTKKPMQYKTVQERAEATLKLLDQVGQQASTPALKQLAQVLRAQVLLGMGKAEETAQVLQALSPEQLDITLQPLFHDLQALSQERRKQNQAALLVDKEQSVKAPLYYQPLFRLAQARLLQTDGKTKEALDLYRQLSTVTWSDPYKDWVANRVVALETGSP